MPRYTIELNTETHAAAKVAAAIERITLSEYVERVLAAVLLSPARLRLLDELERIERIEQTPPPDEYMEEIETGKYKPLK